MTLIVALSKDNFMFMAADSLASWRLTEGEAGGGSLPSFPLGSDLGDRSLGYGHPVEKIVAVADNAY